MITEDRMVSILDGLLYPSQSEQPIHFFRLPYSGSLPLTFDAVANIFSIPPEHRIVEHDPYEFWAEIIFAQPWHKAQWKERTVRFLQIKQTFDTELTEMQFFEIGRVEVNLLYTGRKGEELVGLRTRATRT